MRLDNASPRRTEREEALRERAARRERIRQRRHRREVREMVRADKRMEKLNEAVRQVCISSTVDGSPTTSRTEDNTHNNQDEPPQHFEGVVEEVGGSQGITHEVEKEKEKPVEPEVEGDISQTSEGETVCAPTEPVEDLNGSEVKNEAGDNLDHQAEEDDEEDEEESRSASQRKEAQEALTKVKAGESKAVGVSPAKPPSAADNGDAPVLEPKRRRERERFPREKGKTIQPPQAPRPNTAYVPHRKVDKRSKRFSPRRPFGNPSLEQSTDISIRDFVNLQSQNAALRARVARLHRQMAQTPRHKRRPKQVQVTTTTEAFRVDRQAVAKYVRHKLRADEKYLWNLKEPSGRGKCARHLKLKPHRPRSNVPRKSLRLTYCNFSHLRVPTEEKRSRKRLRKKHFRKGLAKPSVPIDSRHEIDAAQHVSSDPQADLVTWTVNDSYDWADSQLYQDCHRKLNEAFPDLDGCLATVSYNPSKLPRAFSEASTRLRVLWKELRVPHDLQLRQQALFLDKPSLNNYVRILNYTARYLTLRTKLLLVFARIKEGRQFVDLLRDVHGPSCKRFIVNGLDRSQLAEQGD